MVEAVGRIRIVEREADVAAHQHAPPVRAEHPADERRRGGLSLRARDGNDGAPQPPPRELQLANDRDAVLISLLNAVQVEALPSDLPPHIDVDLSALTEIGQTVSVGDLTLPDNVTLLSDPDEVIAKYDYVQVEEEEEEVVAEEEEAEPEVIRERKEEEEE